MISFSPHFCKGRLPVAFIFSVPGTEEVIQGKPVSGDTGENLDIALEHLHVKLPTLFESKFRYDYRITNAFDQPIAVGLGHTESEASRAKIQSPQNLSRVLQDIDGCTYVILCGDKAKLLLDPVLKSGKSAITVPHVGNKGLNGTFNNKYLENVFVSSDRRKHRVMLWVDSVLQKIERCNSV